MRRAVSHPVFVRVLLWAFAAGGLAAVAPGIDAGEAGRDSGRAAQLPGCHSLADGRGEQVRAPRGDSAITASSSSAAACPPRGPVAAAAPQPQQRDPAPASVPGLAAGVVEVDAASLGDRDLDAVSAIRITPERLTGTVVTGGTMVLLLHSSLWTYLLVLGLPVWRHVDLLPIVDSAAPSGALPALPAPDAEAEAEQAIAHVLDPDARDEARRRDG